MKTKTNRLLATLLAVSMLSSMMTIPASASFADANNSLDSTTEDDTNESDIANTGNILTDIGMDPNGSTEVAAISETPLRSGSYTSGDCNELYTFNTDGALLYGDGKDVLINSAFDNGTAKNAPISGNASNVIKTAEGDFGGTGRDEGVASLYSAGGNLMLQLTDPLDDSFKAEPILVCEDWDTQLWRLSEDKTELADLARINCSAVAAGDFNNDGRDDLAVAYAPLSLTDNNEIVYGQIVIKTYTTNTPRWNRGEDAAGWRLDGTWTNTEQANAYKYTRKHTNKYNYAWDLTAATGDYYDPELYETYYHYIMEKDETAIALNPNMFSLAAGPLYEGEENQGRDFLLLTTSYFELDASTDSISSNLEGDANFLTASTSILHVLNPDSAEENRIKEFTSYDTNLMRAGVTVDYISNDDIDPGEGSEYNVEASKRMTPYVVVGGTKIEGDFRFQYALGNAAQLHAPIYCNIWRGLYNTTKILNWYDKEYDEDNQESSVIKNGYKPYDSTTYKGEAAGNYGFGIYNNGYIRQEREISTFYELHIDISKPVYQTYLSAVAVVVATAGELYQQANNGSDVVTGEDMVNQDDDLYGRCTYIMTDATQYMFYPETVKVEYSDTNEVLNVKTCNPITDGVLALDASYDYPVFAGLGDMDCVGWQYNGKNGKMSAISGEFYYATSANGIRTKPLETAHIQLYVDKSTQFVNPIINYVYESTNLLYFIKNGTFDSSAYGNIKSASKKTTTTSVYSLGTCSYALPNTDVDGYSYIYEGQETVYSDPEIMAVLASPPCFRDLAQLDGGSSMQSSTTSFGTSSGQETDDEHGYSLSIGAYVTVEQELRAPIIAKRVAKVELETELAYTFSNAYGSVDSITYSDTYSTKGGHDSVVLYSVPYDVYYYRVYMQGYDGYSLVSYRVPKTPATSVLSLEEYNVIATRYNMDTISLEHTPGDPGSYTVNSYGADNMLFVSKASQYGDESGYATVGRDGATITETSIEAVQGNSVTFEHSVDASVRFGGGGPSVVVGVTAGAGYNYSTTTVNTTGTSYSCCVDALPAGTPKTYDFSWQMQVYKMSTTNVNGGKTEYPLITYNLVNVKQPPLLPSNLRVVDTNETSIALAWDINDDNATYELIREGGGQSVTITDIRGSRYTDTGLDKNVEYTYKIRSVRGISSSIESEAINAYTHAKMTVTASAFVENTKSFSSESVKAKLGDCVNIIVTDDNVEAVLMSYVWEKLNPATNRWERFEWDTFDYKTGKFTFKSMLPDNYGTYRCKVTRKNDTINETIYSNELTIDFNGKMKLPLNIEAKSMYNDDIIYGNENMTFNMYLDNELIIFDEKYDKMELSLTYNGKPLSFELTVPTETESPIQIALTGEATTQTINLSELKYGLRRFALSIPQEMNGVLEMSAVVVSTSKNYFENKYSTSCYINKYLNGNDIPEAKKFINLSLNAEYGKIEVNGTSSTDVSVPYGSTLKLRAVPNDGYTIASLDNTKQQNAPGATPTATAVYYTDDDGNKVYAESLGDGYYQFVGLAVDGTEKFGAVAVNAEFEKITIECTLNADSENEATGFTLGGSVGETEILCATGEENAVIPSIAPVDNPVLTLTIEPNKNCTITSWSYEEFGTGEVVDLLAKAKQEDGTNRLVATCQLSLDTMNDIEISATASELSSQKLTLNVSDTNGSADGGLNGVLGYTAVRTDVYSENLSLEYTTERSDITSGAFDIYGKNPSITITAKPDEGYSISEWFVNGEKLESTDDFITLDEFTEATDVSVSFVNANSESYPVYFAGDGMGSVKATVGSNDVSTQNGGVFAKGSTLVLNAVAEPGNDFVCWTKNGIEFSDNAEIKYIVDNQASFVAVFEKSVYSISCENNVSASAKTAFYGDKVTFTAIIREESSIIGWRVNGESVSLDFESPYTLTLTISEDVVVRAVYDTDEPEETTIPDETTVPEETTIPDETTVPEETTIPDETTVPEETTIPDETTIPEETTIPDETTVPEETTTPDETTVPEETTIPDETTIPEETTTPDETTVPEETTTPDETTTPEETTTPDETTIPKETTTPDETTTPEETTTPDETTTPEETTTPDETTTPEETTTDDVDEPTEPESKGDADGNGIIDVADALLVLMTSAEVIDEPTQEHFAAFDVDSNGIITSYDAFLILMYEAEMIDEFPKANS